MQSIKRFDLTTEFSTPERCFIVELLGHHDDNVCSIARARVEPGITTQWHALRGVAERYVILEGTGLMEIGGAPGVEVGPLDVVSILPGVSQRITNTGKIDLIFLCICTPPFQPSVYMLTWRPETKKGAN